MELELTVIDPLRLGASAEVVISAPMGTPLSAVADQLAEAVGIAGPEQRPGSPPGWQFRCDQGRLAHSDPLGLPPLLQGAVLLISSEAPGTDQRPVFEGPIRRGGSRQAESTPDRPAAAVTLDGEGYRRVNRGPQLQPARDPSEIHFPAPPATPSAARFPWLMVLLPLLLAIPVAVIWRQPGFAAFALLTPILMAGQYVADRRTAGRQSADQSRLLQAGRARSQAALEAAMGADLAYLEAARPDLARVGVMAGTPTDELWCRGANDPDFLTVRLGRGVEAAAIVVHRPAAEQFATTSGPAAGLHPDAPIAVNLANTGVLGVCGSRSAVLGLARSLIAQLAVLHSPADLRIEVLTAELVDRRDWRWLDRLPHSGDEGQVAELGGIRRVLVLDGVYRLRRRPDICAVLDIAVPGAATVLICLAQTEQHLPAHCRATVCLDQPAAPDCPDRTGLVRRAQAPSVAFSPELASARWAERLGRHLASLRDASPAPGQGLPGSVRLIDLLISDDQVQPTDPRDLARHWRRGPEQRPVAVLGRTATGPFRIDLCRDGPHLLIGGTTGAGKSELLQTLVASLAVGSGPDAVAFLLIDYKGGAAFRSCARLPHVGGIITDLDPRLARRALACLTAELRQRERRLNSVGAADIDGYAAARSVRPGLAALPRLVVVVDEFRVLAEELPEFVSGLVRIATVGRSLGVHLVLATQRPAGVVSAEIQANVNLRIALRVRDAADSRDLIDDPAASRLPSEMPGRALARVGSGELASFQTARVSGTSRPGHTQHRPVVRRLVQPGEGWTASRPVAGGPSADDGEPDLAAIATAARQAAGWLSMAPVAPPWLPPLPDVVRLEDLFPLVASSVTALGGPSTSASALPFGLIDLPDEQRQDVGAWQLRGTNLAVVGGPRSGRTTALTGLVLVATIMAAARVAVLDELHFYLLDGAGTLAQLRRAPLVDAVVPMPDLERCQRLLDRLSAEVGARQSAAAGGGSQLRESTVVVVIDGWETLTSAWAEVDHGRMLDQLICLLRDGPAVGVCTAVSGGRSLLTGAISSLLAERVVLRFADPADALLAGVPAARLDGSSPAGRGILLGPGRPAGVELQVALAQVPEQSAGGSLADRPGRPGWRVPELPTLLEHGRLIALWHEARQQRWSMPVVAGTGGCEVPVGIGGDQASVVTLDLAATAVTLVVGAPGSGRSSALACIAAGLSWLGQPVLFVSPTAAVDGPQIPVVDPRQPGAAEQLAFLLARQPEATVLVDDLPPTDPRLAGGGEAIGELLAAQLRTGRLVVASTTTDLLGAYRGVLAIARTAARSGLLLGRPAPGDGELFGLRLGQRAPGPPGRALLIQSGRACVVQLALPPSLAATPSDPACLEPDSVFPQPGDAFPQPGAAFPQAGGAFPQARVAAR